jgi:CO dehydrogenase/acetyl-CoA synthase beta subunit
VSFGKLICNYKAETVSSVMKFFLPPADPNAAQVKAEEKKEEEKIDETMVSKISMNESMNYQKAEKFSMKVHLNMAQISLRLINAKNKIFFAEFSM